jgi:CPA2 family monovalent cation:H+ antiporter-2
MEAYSELTGLAVVVLVAAVCGVAMTRLGQPAIVGYILAGVLLGPSGVGLVQNRDQIGTLAELGVLLLLFFIGMELSLRAFKGVWRTALIATVLQIAGSVGVTLVLSTLLGWPLGFAVLLGFVVALSSTAVVIKMLEDMNILRTPVAQITVGVLIAQDLAFVPMIIAVDTLAGDAFEWTAVAKIAGSVVVLTLLIRYLSRRRRIRIPFAKAVAGHRDLTPLRGLALCFAAAAVTGLMGLSAAYGAFLAGLVIGSSTERAEFVRSIQPIQSILMMVFFMSIGLLIDLGFIWDNIGTVLLILFIVTVLKTGLNIGVLRVAGQPWAHAYITGILLAQIGEFSFLLGEAGVRAGLVGPAERNLIVAVTALSLVVSPLWQVCARRLQRIAILGVTSRPEVTRLFFGRHAPKVFAARSAVAARGRRVLAAASGSIGPKRSAGAASAEHEGGSAEAAPASAGPDLSPPAEAGSAKAGPPDEPDPP